MTVGATSEDASATDISFDMDDLSPVSPWQSRALPVLAAILPGQPTRHRLQSTGATFEMVVVCHKSLPENIISPLSQSQNSIVVGFNPHKAITLQFLPQNKLKLKNSD